MSGTAHIHELLGAINTSIDSKPRIFDLSSDSDISELETLIRADKIKLKVDDFESQERDLYSIDNPSKAIAPDFDASFNRYYSDLLADRPAYAQGRWAYFPWISTVVHILSEEDFFRVRTARNRNLIQADEQKQFYDAVIGIGGLSVGNSVALSLVLQGGAHTIRLADFDRLSLSNLNRIRAGIEALGLPKTEMTARQIYLLDPYAKIQIFSEGLTESNLPLFLDGLSVVVDELDTIPLKMRIREEAKKRKLPVVMGADNGDGAIIDIERYDLEDGTEYFHGRLAEVTVEELMYLDKIGIGRTITKLIGPENVAERMRLSLLEIGKTIPSWPQLGGAALLNGAAIAYCVRRIVTGGELETNRAIISLDEKLVPSYLSAPEVERRAKATKAFASRFGL